MPNRRHYRGPRRPAADGAEGSVPEGAAPRAASFGGAEGAAGDGARPAARRRRRGRGGRGSGLRPDAPGGASPDSGAAESSGEGYGAPDRTGSRPRFETGGIGEAGPREGGDEARRRRRRRGRGRGGERPPGAAPEPETAEGELPADYIPLQVEHGTAFLFEPPTRALEVVEREEEARKPQKSKRVNSGKLFWYIRSKSYVPIPELRRRFEITPDEMGTIQDHDQKVYIGLPQDVADVVANLRRQQKIGLECSVDFTTPVVIGVYPLNR